MVLSIDEGQFHTDYALEFETCFFEMNYGVCEPFNEMVI